MPNSLIEVQEIGNTLGMTSGDNLLGQIKIRLFGPMHVEVDSLPIPPLRTKKGMWLLAVLTFRANREVSRVWLAGTLWPDSSESQSLENLRHSLSELRKALGAASFRIESPTSNTLLLRLKPCESDVLAFDIASKSTEHALSELELAAALYTAPLLEDCYEVWAANDQENRRESYLSLLERLAKLKREAGAFSQAIKYLRLALKADPIRESLTSQLMQAFAENGDSAAAGEAFRELRTALAAISNAEPSADLVALYKRLRKDGRKDHPLLAPATISTPTSPKHSFSKNASLPTPLTPLIGRETELREIAKMLSESRLATLTGPGGIGKTRLSIQAGCDSLSQFEDGAWFVELAPLTQPDQIAQAVANAMGLREDSAASQFESLLKFLSDRSVLIILDNCEHLIQGSADFAGRLLSECADVHILATSRQPLGITGEVVWRAPSLGIPPESSLESLVWESPLEQLSAKYAAVRLFQDRARAVQPFADPTPAGLRAIIEICKRLDGIPLAIELAAVRVKTLSLEQIALRLNDCFRLLTGGSRNALPRQQTLRALIDWSYDLLSEPEKTLFRRLSIFVGGFSLDSAEAICVDTGESKGAIRQEDVFDILSELSDKSLLTSEADEFGERRYGMLETVRQYAIEKLQASGESQTLTKRFVESFAALAEKAEPFLLTEQGTRWFRVFDREQANFRQAITSSRDFEEDESELRLCVQLAQYWILRGHWRDGRDFLTHALLPEGRPELKWLRAKGHAKSGILSRHLDEIPASRASQCKSLELRREIGDQIGIAMSLNSLGLISFENEADLETAAILFEQSLEICNLIGDREATAKVMNNLALVHQGQGDLELAKSLLLESVQINSNLKNYPILARNLHNLGSISLDQGDYEEARTYCEQCLELGASSGDQIGMIEARFTLGLIAIKESDFEMASTHFLQALSLSENIGSQSQIVRGINKLALLASHIGRWKKAAMIYGAIDCFHNFSQSALLLNMTESTEYNRDQLKLMEALGTTEYRYAYSCGQKMSLEQTIAYVREDR